MDNHFQLLLHEAEGDVLVIALRGEVDMSTAGLVKEATTKAIGTGGYRCIVFDLNRVSFMDSSGLHVMVDTHRKMQDGGGNVKIVSSSPNLARIFELTGISRLLTVVPDRESAVALAA
jgi:anti-anti-sigma factor